MENITETKQCQECGQDFTITDWDMAFYKKMGVPTPTLCPDDRQRRRCLTRNHRNFYQRKCDSTGKDIISVISPDKPYTVYETSAWWEDSWDPLDYGRDFDFNRPFFDQFDELSRKVPQMAARVSKSENCEYNTNMTECRNCYMCSNTHVSEDITHSFWVGWGKNSIDCSYCVKIELCYECLDAEGCFNSSFLQSCENVNDSHFMYDCTGCNDCFGCVGLRHKKHHFFNEQLTEEEYKKKMEEVFPLTTEKIETYLKKFEEFKLKFPHRAVWIVNCENCSGDYLKNNKNCHHCFDLFNGKDMKYCFDSAGMNMTMDCFQAGIGDCNYVYEVSSATYLNDCAFCMGINSGNKVYYSIDCYNCSDCFGCNGLRHKKHCIFNKQYSKEEYKALREKIVTHMQETNEWGEFFPIKYAFYGYNESEAQRYYPITKEEALAKGYKWKDEDKKQYQPATQDILACSDCGKNYKFIQKELDFYQSQGFPLPKKCPDCRHERRIALRNPRKLWDRNCNKCNADIQTTYAPERPEIIYCEKCYLKELY